ncbi:hypothetical protein AAC03nite_34320 [Alicyclobacillus acidoterrestris]|nr:hypothetical protein AAC03nite_34320 [Alicyclobacillus acidoterrestris]
MHLNWNAIGAIGNWVGAVSTTAAVIVSLWATRKSIMPRIRITSSLGIAAYGSGTEPLILLTASNIGQVPITLTSCVIELPNKHPVVMFDSLREFPKKIGAGDTAQVTLPLTEVAKIIAGEGYHGKTPVNVIFRANTGEYKKKWSLNITQPTE